MDKNELKLLSDAIDQLSSREWIPHDLGAWCRSCQRVQDEDHAENCSYQNLLRELRELYDKYWQG